MGQEQRLRVAVVGASGYGGGELARLLAGHPQAHIAVATASGERAGAKMSDLYPSLRGICDVVCQEFNVGRIAAACDFVFMSLPHGKAMAIVPPLLERGLKVCDFGGDFRLRDTAVYEEWYKLSHTACSALREAVYGLPEYNREQIRTARLVANPGCYPTSAILSLAPLVAADVVDRRSLIVDSASGSSGAGRSSFGLGMHHPEISGDFRAYNVAAHRHTPEIEQALNDVAGDAHEPFRISFTAHLLPISRGILSTCYANLKEDLDTAAVHRVIEEKYAEEPFVRVHPPGSLPQIKHVLGSNFIDIGVKVDTRTGRAIVISAEDNLVKGAAGQAVQNMNLMCGFTETIALLSAPVFP